jgi:hypothetical protein
LPFEFNLQRYTADKAAAAGGKAGGKAATVETAATLWWGCTS